MRMVEDRGHFKDTVPYHSFARTNPPRTASPILRSADEEIFRKSFLQLRKSCNRLSRKNQPDCRPPKGCRVAPTAQDLCNIEFLAETVTQLDESYSLYGMLRDGTARVVMRLLRQMIRQSRLMFGINELARAPGLHLEPTDWNSQR